MAFPLVPVILLGAGVAAVGYVLATRGGSLPPELQAPFQDLLAHGTDPDAMDQAANKLAAEGFPKEAAQLHARATLLRGQKPGAQPAAPAQPAQPAPPGAPPPPPAPPAPLPGLPAAPPAVSAQFMKVTTNDPAPSGDLALRSAPLDSAAVTGAAEKDSIVTVKSVSPDGKFIQVEALNPAGRRQSTTGWGHAAFLVPANPMKTSGHLAPAATLATLLTGGARPAGMAPASCEHPGGLEMRPAPTYAAGVMAVLARGASCEVVSKIDGRRHDQGSPSPGGWALVVEDETGLRGWVPSEWLLLPGGS